ncbi:EAL domain-containing protein [Neptuniibacter sp.]|uniref:EAL domain-containing protein n=1 Tax=Neptuniibacter sp. TaxID=1962643 RepID=UPI00262E287D|nr:EAL domain-containing protein [Neptuniibacter sp.]MCP4597358.1 EAL domain-containing protein [Neptuniibacter sp.]
MRTTILDTEGYRIQLPAGAVIFQEGEAGDRAYIVDSGEIGVSTRVNDRELQFAIAQHGDILGEMALIDHGVRTATATVLNDAELIVIPKDYIHRLVTTADPTVNLLMQIVMQRYREMKSHFDTISAGGSLDSIEVKPKLENSQLKAQTEMAMRRVTEEQRLRKALHNDELRLFYQPIIDLNNGAILGCEALIRWQDPERGLVPPIQFIALAEETGLIEPIGHWIFSEASQAVNKFNALAGKDDAFFISVNLSSRQIETDRQVEVLTDYLLDNDIELTNFKLEITETLLMSDPLRISQVLTEFKRFGCKIALDDFGTGYSSFSYLHRFPIDSIKIDRSFVSTMAENPTSKAIVRTLCTLAESLEMSTIAEGVEEEKDQTMLQAFNCNFGQGFYYSTPIPEDEFMALIQKQLSAA